MVGCPPEYLCPITKKLMVDPAVAADGRTYERRAIQGWLNTEVSNPNAKIGSPHFSLRPDHEMKAKIARWQAEQEKNPEKRAEEELEKLLKRQVMQITWATTSQEVTREINKLIEFVEQRKAVVPPSQMGRLRGCLKADPNIWCDEVSEPLDKLDAKCQQVADSLAQRMRTARLAGQRASKNMDETRATVSKLETEITSAEKHITALKLQLTNVEQKHQTACRREGLYRQEVEKLAKMLQEQQGSRSGSPARSQDGEDVNLKRVRELGQVCDAERKAKRRANKNSNSPVKSDPVGVMRTAAQVAGRLKGSGYVQESHMVARWQKMLEGGNKTGAELQQAAGVARKLAAQLRSNGDEDEAERAKCGLDVLCGLAGVPAPASPPSSPRHEGFTSLGNSNRLGESCETGIPAKS